MIACKVYKKILEHCLRLKKSSWRYRARCFNQNAEPVCEVAALPFPRQLLGSTCASKYQSGRGLLAYWITKASYRHKLVAYSWQHSNLETRSDFIQWLAALLAWGKRPNSLWSTAASKTTAKTNLCDACSSFFTSLMRPLIAPGRFWQNDGNYCTTLRWWESVEMFQSPTEHAWTSMMINFNPVFQVMTSRSESLRLQTRSKQSTSLRWWKTRDRSCTPTSRRASETAGW